MCAYIDIDMYSFNQKQDPVKGVDVRRSLRGSREEMSRVSFPTLRCLLEADALLS